MSIEEYIKERLNKQQQWHSNKAVTFKKRYYVCQVIAVICTIITPIFITFYRIYEYESLFILSACASIIVGISQSISVLFKWKDIWLNYRAISEQLKSYLYYFQTSDKNKKDEIKLRNNVENLLMSEHKKWLEIQHDEEIMADNTPKTTHKK